MENEVRLPYYEEVQYFALADSIPINWHEVPMRQSKFQALTLGSAAFPIAILDTGIDVDHPELQGKVTKRYDATGEGFDALHPHGTHVAGVIVGSKNLDGVAQDAVLYDVKVLDSTGNGSNEGVARGIEWAIGAGARIINLSLGSRNPSEEVRLAIKAAKAQGIIIIAAAGNSADGGVNWPGADANSLAVAAAYHIKELGWDIADYSSKGPQTDLAAPGHKITSCIPGGDYATYNGTSMATPYVAGIANLLLTLSTKQLDHTTVTNAMKMTAIDILTPGEDDHSGAGVIDPYKLLSRVNQIEPPTTPTQKKKLPWYAVAGITFILYIIIQVIINAFRN